MALWKVDPVLIVSLTNMFMRATQFIGEETALFRSYSSVSR